MTDRSLTPAEATAMFDAVDSATLAREEAVLRREPADRIAAIRARAEAAQADPFFLSDCQGELQVWRESALSYVRRDDDGEVISYSFPSSYRATDQIIEIDLDSWDPGEDAADDQRRADIEALVTARQDDVPYLLARLDRLAETLRQLDAVVSNERLTDKQIVSEALDILIAHHEAEERAVEREAVS